MYLPFAFKSVETTEPLHKQNLQSTFKHSRACSQYRAINEPKDDNKGPNFAQSKKCSIQFLDTSMFELEVSIITKSAAQTKIF